MINRRNILTLAASAASCLAWRQTALAQVNQKSWADVVSAAKKEGSVQVYAASPLPVMKRVLKPFSDAFPEITVYIQRIVSGPQAVKLDQERQNGSDGADFALAGPDWFVAREKEGLLLAPRGPSLASWPKEGTQGNGVVLAGYDPFVIAYSKDRVAVQPEGYASLLKPEFKNKVGTSEVTSGTAAVALYDFIEKTVDPDYFRKMWANGLRLYPNTTASAQAVAAGEIDVALYSSPSNVVAANEGGASVAFVVPRPKAVSLPIAMAALSWAKRPHAALLLLDYMMSKEGQTAFWGMGDGVSPRSDVTGSFPLDSARPYDADAYTPEVVAQYRARWLKNK